MSRPIIEVSHLTKAYQLGAIGGINLRDAFTQWRARLSGGQAQPERGAFNALDDVSFSVSPGEVVGVIGRNGAGKSTLLKILSRITGPTAGRAVLRGRVASLLEIGTGFHPDLTGRENIFLNGAILGMTRAEIRRKFDEIVAFSEVERFIDTPVKRYSSGMHVRLAFAVAAHLEPEILIIDEVLAVGDAQFQKKCLGKLESVALGEGRTVLFVSHDLAAVSTLCHSVIHLSAGRLIGRGKTRDTLAQYAAQVDLIGGECDLQRPEVKRRGTGAGRFIGARLVGPTGELIAAAVQGVPFRLEVDLAAKATLAVGTIAVTLVDSADRELFTTIHYDALELRELAAGTHHFAIEFDPNFLARGSYNVRLSCQGPHLEEYDRLSDAFSLLVASSASDRDVALPRPGVVRLPLRWAHRHAS
jgi:lipopolysaccharide transport system ATP-binding protein